MMLTTLNMTPQIVIGDNNDTKDERDDDNPEIGGDDAYHDNDDDHDAEEQYPWEEDAKDAEAYDDDNVETDDVDAAWRSRRGRFTWTSG